MARDHSRARSSPLVGTIVLARHGRPALDRSVRVDWRGFQTWWEAYDLGGLAEGQAPPHALLHAAAHADLIYSSTLKRSMETAAAVARGRPVIHDAIFNEAALPPPAIPGRHRPETWGIWARIAWWLGFHRGAESRWEAELRAQAAVATLAAKALRGQAVLVLAHGWFNRMMRPVLRAQGWRCVEDGGDDYWSFRRYEHRAVKSPKSAAFQPSNQQSLEEAIP
jgi:broad specificity phosphatase PhoE